MFSNESQRIFSAFVEALPAEEDFYQIFLHLEDGGHGLSRALKIMELSGAALHSLSVLPSPLMDKKIVVFRFYDTDLKHVILDLIREGFLEVKGCGPRKGCAPRHGAGWCDMG